MSTKGAGSAASSPTPGDVTAAATSASAARTAGTTSRPIRLRACWTDSRIGKQTIIGVQQTVTGTRAESSTAAADSESTPASPDHAGVSSGALDPGPVTA